MRMWILRGTAGGIHGIFQSKHKAEEASKSLWNISKPRYEQVEVLNNGYFLEILKYKKIIKKQPIEIILEMKNNRT